MKLDLKNRRTDSEIKYDMLRMLAWIQLCGSIGHSAELSIFIDGDGDSNYTFEFEDPKDQEAFDILRKELLDFYQKKGNVRKLNI